MVLKSSVEPLGSLQLERPTPGAPVFRSPV